MLQSERCASKWRKIIDSLKSATPEDRALPPEFDDVVRTILTKFAWACVTVHPSADELRKKAQAKARLHARAVLRELREFEEAWAAFEDADSDIFTVFRDHPEAAMHAVFVRPGLDAILRAVREVATVVADYGPTNRGGRHRDRGYEGLLALCARLYAPVTGRTPSASKSDPFVKFVHCVTDLMAELPAGTFPVPVSDAARRKRLARLMGGARQNRAAK
ncbi:MAG: hypothetical protein ACLP4V_25420 [Methylocella sp.]